jgi:hypothetical protein
MAEIKSFPWVELAVLAPGQSHFWFFEQSHDVHGWVFQATAYPEAPGSGEENTLSSSRVEVTELFILRQGGEIQGSKHRSQINITVTNCGDRWAPYSLWVVSTPPRGFRRHADDPYPVTQEARNLRLETRQLPGKAINILVVHDEYGNVKSAAAVAGDPLRRAGLRPQRGEFVTEVDEPVLDPQELRRAPREFCEDFRVDAVNGRLVRKNR